MSYKIADVGVAVVTGGAAGLGAAFTAALLGRGHDVAVLDLVVDGFNAPSGGGRLLRYRGDATDPAVLADFADQVRAELGRPRVLVNNVGYSPYRSFAEETLDGWRTVMTRNVETTVLTTQTFLEDLIAEPDGRIVNLSSSVLWDAESRGMVAYAAAKGAVLGLTRALARELGDRDVTVNAIAPGIVRSPDTERVEPETFERYRQRQAVPRIADPEDLVTSLLYLVDRGSGQVTGSVLGVNGGRVWV